MKALSFGEIIWDVYSDGACIGGAAFNFAAHLAVMKNESYLCSATGCDSLGERTAHALDRYGINTEYVQKNAYPTGSCNVSLDTNGKPSFIIAQNTAYDHIKPVTLRGGFDLLYFGTLIQRCPQTLSALKNLISGNRFREIFSDINMRKDCCSREALNFSFGNATMLKISRDEELQLSEEAFFGKYYEKEPVSHYLALGREICGRFGNIRTVIFTLDCDGAAVYSRSFDVCLFHEPERVKVASTVGAGDSFSAAFASGYLNGDSLETCLDTATKLSAYVVSVRDAVPFYDISQIKSGT